MPIPRRAFAEGSGNSGDDPGNGALGCIEIPEVGLVVLVIIIILAALWLIFFVFVPLVIVPVIEVFSTWGSRITIVRQKWKRNVLLRNLRDPDGLLAEIGSRVPIHYVKEER